MGSSVTTVSWQAVVKKVMNMIFLKVPRSILDSRVNRLVSWLVSYFQ